MLSTRHARHRTSEGRRHEGIRRSTWSALLNEARQGTALAGDIHCIGILNRAQTGGGASRESDPKAGIS
jgi:hypothetical protein